MTRDFILLILVLLGWGELTSGVKGAAINDMNSYLVTHGYAGVKVKTTERNSQVVQAEIDGKEVSLVIDTGCWRTTLSASCARELGLQVREMGDKSWALSGSMKMGRALVKSVKLNGHEITRTNTVEVLPESAGRFGNGDGLLGLDFLTLNRAILPVASGVLLFQPVQNSPTAIGSFMKSAGFSAVPVHFLKGAGMVIDGMVNGKPLHAVVDCGASFTVFDLAYVKKMGGEGFELKNFRTIDAAGTSTRASGFTPDSMSLGPLAIKPMEVTATSEPTFARIGIDALVGYDLMGEHKAIVDLSDRVLWMK